MSERLASIDELLQHEEEPPRPERDRRGGRAVGVIKVLLGAGVLTVVAVLALRQAGYAAPYPLLFAGFLALLLLRWLVREVSPPPAPRGHPARRQGGEEEGLYQWGASDALRSALSRWENRLDAGRSDPQRFARIVQPALIEIVDERLRRRHGIARAAEPGRARELLGDPLWTLMSQPVRRSPSPRELAAIVSRVEGL